MSSKLTRNEFFHTPKRGKSQVADGADELKDTPLLSSVPACTQRALSNTIGTALGILLPFTRNLTFYVENRFRRTTYRKEYLCPPK